jgi:putative N6-adenine-specific DNA methylase
MDLARPRDIRVSCAPALAPFLAEELEGLGMPVVRRSRTMVTTHGDWTDTWRLCLELRTAFQVLYPLKTFGCTSPQDLYRAVRAMAWESILPPDGYFTVESRVDHRSINNSMFPNLRVKDAVADRMTAETGRRPDSGSERRGVVVHLHWTSDRATIALNASGRKLADRGYRRRPHRAPLQETLAAAVVLATGWRGDVPLALPMCGSGTLAIEAALLALDRAPGLLRLGFAFEHVRGFDEAAWKRVRAAARKRADRALDVPIVASDLDPEAVEAACANAETAGVRHLIEFRVADFAAAPLPDRPGVLIVNPEYGARLGDEDALRETYARLGTFFKARCPGWTCYLLSGNPRLSSSLGLKASRRVPLFNADIECRLLKYEMWEGARSAPTG